MGLPLLAKCRCCTHLLGRVKELLNITATYSSPLPSVENHVRWCAGGLENLLHHTGNTPAGRGSGDMNDMDGHPQINTVEADYLDYCCSVLQHL